MSDETKGCPSALYDGEDILECVRRSQHGGLHVGVTGRAWAVGMTYAQACAARHRGEQYHQ